ncbi:MAG: cell division protein ZapA [Magnetococcales bacterium]|nr:cell division protein ZapA [Magnetococcales bacterium]NGZ06654.1 cell division protein ZapA [Magnetococcales bacterium]
MAETFEVRIRGQVFKLKSQASGEYVRELAQYVNEVMAQVSQESQIITGDRVAIMAALKIADDFKQHQRQTAKQTEVAQAKISGMIAQSDRLLQG